MAHVTLIVQASTLAVIVYELLSFNNFHLIIHYKKCKVTPLRARCGPEVGRGIALLFHDLGTRRG
jgi:hypothetical protein